MSFYYLSIGSNIEPEKNIPHCLQALKAAVSIEKISSVFETIPFGPAGDDHFWNLVVKIHYLHSQEELAVLLKTIEKNLGRKREVSNKFAPRTIDIDLLSEGFEALPFIMIPLAEVEPQGMDPKTGKTFQALADQFTEEKKSYRKIALKI